MRLCPALVVLALVGCHSSSLSRAVPRVWVPHSKAEVVRLAAAAVTSAGFTVTKSDTTAGAMGAVREVAGGGNAPYIRCEQGQGQARAPVTFSSQVFVTVAVRDSAGGGLVGVAAEVPFARTQMAGPHGRPVEWTCWTSGEIERIVIGALQ